MSARWPKSAREYWVPAALAVLTVALLAQTPPPEGVPAGQAPLPPRTLPPERALPASQPVTLQPTDDSPPTSQPAGELASPDQLSARLLSGLIGSKHDFSHGGRRGRDLCLPCHTPHLVAPPKPLLDRRTKSELPLRPFQMQGVALSSWSLLCLGCHDGVTAPDVFQSGHALSLSAQYRGTMFGPRGLRSHPIGIPYPAAYVEGFNPIGAVEGAGLPMPEGRIQCATCHDAHNTYGYGKFLRISNERSKLCLTCHRL